ADLATMSSKYSWLAAGIIAGLVIVAALAIAGPIALAQNGGSGPTVGEAVVGTGFTYQGYLDNGGSAANGLYDFQFKLYDTGAAGTQIGPTLTKNAVNVSQGLFTVPLDFGTGAFGGGARWLQIGVRPAGGGAYTTLSPRQELSPAPSALSLPNVYSDESINFVGV